jgi:uncharacterized PurR-regulated membrane protein YhhQ (DUF165 family)
LNRYTAPLVALFLGAIVLANVLAAHFGPTVTISNAFFLIALDLVTRDKLADFWGTSRWRKQALLIVAGGLLSYLATSATSTIAIASAVSFACAETGEATLYWLVRHRPWLERANISAWLGAAIDSVVFPTLAFGFVWSISFGQFVAKVAGAAIWSVVILKVRAWKAATA